MYNYIAVLIVAISLTAATAAPSGLWGGHLAGPILGPSQLSGPVVGGARISGAVDGGAVVTGSVALPSLVSGSVVGGTAVVEPSLGHGLGGLGLGWGGLGLGHGLGLGLGHGLAGPGVALHGAHSLPSVIAGPSGSIVSGLGGHSGLVSGLWGH